jgi:starch synthase
VSRAALTHAIARTVEAFARPDIWCTIQRNGMRADFSWGASGQRYADLYKHMMEAA